MALGPAAGTSAPAETDLAVIGAGILGLAVARKLQARSGLALARLIADRAEPGLG